MFAFFSLFFLWSEYPELVEVEGWVVALSHGPEPTEQTLGESKENTATKSQWSAALGLKKKKERKRKRKIDGKKPFLLQPNMYNGTDTIFKATEAAFMCTQQPPDRQLLMLTHIRVIKFAFMTLRLNYVLNYHNYCKKRKQRSRGAGFNLRRKMTQYFWLRFIYHRCRPDRFLYLFCTFLWE